VFIGRNASVGEDSILYANVSVYHSCIIGKRVILHSGVVIGADGFGFAAPGVGNDKIPQVGIVQIDDDVELNEIVKKFIEKGPLPFTILQAFDGFEAGALLSDKRPGFVILDIDLPGLDGNQICRRIKNEPAFGKPFVITVTGLDSPDIKARALEAGSDAFLPKPLDFDLLGSILADFAGKVR